ncbi:MAG: hypothetical protein JXQ87_03670 [Bacteroidia bacterium]
MLNKKLYWGTASVIAFMGISALSAGYSLINDPTGADIGLNHELLKNTPFSDFSIPGQIITYWFGIGGLASLSFSFKRFKTFTQTVFAFAATITIWILAQTFLTKQFSLTMAVFLLVGLLLFYLGNRIMTQLKVLKQW